ANSAACCTSVNSSGVGSLGSAVEGGGASAATESPRDRAVRQGRRRVSSRSLHKGTARAGGWFKRVLFLSPAGSGGAARGPGRRARRRPYGGCPGHSGAVCEELRGKRCWPATSRDSFTRAQLVMYLQIGRAHV